MLWLKLASAGLWHLIVDYALGSSLIAALLLAAFGLSLIGRIPLIGTALASMLAPLKLDLIWAAVAVAGAILWGAHMQRDEHARCVAKETVIVHAVDEAVKGATAPAAKDLADPYDSPNN